MDLDAVESISEILPKMERLERKARLDLSGLLDSELGRETDMVVVLGMQGQQVMMVVVVVVLLLLGLQGQQVMVMVTVVVLVLVLGKQGQQVRPYILFLCLELKGMVYLIYKPHITALFVCVK